MPVLKKERIKDQMLRTAARLWSVPENEIETSFDPLVLLMMEACAAELEKIGNELNVSHTRLLERLADLLIPEADLGLKPASAIAGATPVDTVSAVDDTTRYYAAQQLVKNEAGIASRQDLYFTPIGRFTLQKASLAYVMAGAKLFKMKEGGPRETVHGSSSDAGGLHSDIWFAIAADKTLPSLQGLSLFFDLRSHTDAGAFYNSLAAAKASVSGQDAGLRAGYFHSAQFELNPEEMLSEGHNISKKTTRRIAGMYRRHFMHLDTKLTAAQLLAGGMPERLKQLLPQNIAQQLAGEPLIYLNIALDRPFQQDVLDGLTCGINAFPVINRKLHALNHRTDAWVNIIPMKVEGGFLDLQSVTSAAGGRYQFRITGNAQDMQEGEAVVRSSGVGRASSPEVREIIGSLMEAIRDESAYFSEVSNDFILTRLREISQILTRLEDQIGAAQDVREAKSYLLLRPKQTGETVAVSYWTTNGTVANGLRPGTVLTPSGHTLSGPKGAFLLTPSAGGKSTMTETEKMLTLRRQISSGGRLVSAEDIKMLCARIFGAKLRNATVQKGVQMGYGKEEGFIRTIDVTIQVSEDAVDTEETAYLRRELEYALETEGSVACTFRVVVG